MKKYFLPVLTELLGAALSLALIHFLFVPFFSPLIDMSKGAMYGYSITLLFLFTCARIVSVLKGNDKITAIVDKWLKK